MASSITGYRCGRIGTSMTTLDFTSTSADGVRQAAEPVISVTTIVANLGGHPAVTVPMITGETPDVNWTWDYLAEPAGFFGITMPTRDALRFALERFDSSATSRETRRRIVAVTIMLVEVNGGAQFVITGVPVRQFDPAAVCVAVGPDSSWLAPGAAEPLWRRMAARTSSQGDVDQLSRSLNGDDFVDQVGRLDQSMIGPPALGALVFGHGDEFIGLESPRAASVLALMERCGAILSGTITRASDFVAPAAASSAWWISPSFEVHPAACIGDVHYLRDEIDSGLIPAFLGSLA